MNHSVYPIHVELATVARLIFIPIQIQDKYTHCSAEHMIPVMTTLSTLPNGWCTVIPTPSQTHTQPIKYSTLCALIRRVGQDYADKAIKPTTQKPRRQMCSRLTRWDLVQLECLERGSTTKLACKPPRSPHLECATPPHTSSFLHFLHCFGLLFDYILCGARGATAGTSEA